MNYTGQVSGMCDINSILHIAEMQFLAHVLKQSYWITNYS